MIEIDHRAWHPQGTLITLHDRARHGHGHSLLEDALGACFSGGWDRFTRQLPAFLSTASRSPCLSVQRLLVPSNGA